VVKSDRPFCLSHPTSRLPLLFRGRHPAVTGLVLVTAIFSFGCRAQKQFPPQPVQIIGRSYHPEGMEGDTSGTVSRAGSSLTASGDAEVPALALDPLQGRLVARQMAKQMARRELARKVEAVVVRPGETVGDLIRKDPEKRRKVEELIRQAPQKGLIKSGTNRYSILLTLDLRSLNKSLALSGEPIGAAGPTSATATSSKEFRKRLEKEAAENARIRALEYVKGLLIEGKETVGERMLRRNTLDRAIRQKVASLAPAGVMFREGGTCEVTLIVDLAEIQRLVKKHR